MENSILGYFYNIFDFGLDLFTSFYVLNNWFSVLITFFIVFFSVRFFIKPIMGGSDGVSSTISKVRKNSKKSKK